MLGNLIKELQKKYSLQIHFRPCQCRRSIWFENIFEIFPSESDCELDLLDWLSDQTKCEVVNKTKGRSIYSLIFNFGILTI